MNYGDGERQSYSFDAMNNRATKSDTIAGVGGGASTTVNESYSVDAANRLTSRTVSGASTTVTSDADGNVLTDGTRTNTWDSQNRLVSCATSGTSGTTSAFSYGSDGLRRRGTVTASDGTYTQTDYVYDASMLIEEVVQHFSSTGTALDTPTTITYFQGPQGPLYRKSSAEADPSWYIYDGLGSVVGEVNAAASVTASDLYDVYGAKRGYSGTPTTSQGFVGGLGHETDSEIGLIYMRARYYDPSTGRFASEDPSKDSYNWYTYCADSPCNNVDLSGRDITSVLGWELYLSGLAIMMATTESAIAMFQAIKTAFGAYIKAAKAIATTAFKLDYGLIKTISLILDQWSLMDALSGLCGPVGASLAIHHTGYAMACLGMYMLIDTDGPDPANQ